MTRDEAIEAGARALDPSAWDDALWASASGWGLLAQPSRKAEARSVVATVLDAIGWRPEVEVQAEALRQAAQALYADDTAERGTSKALLHAIYAAWLMDRADALDGAE